MDKYSLFSCSKCAWPCGWCAARHQCVLDTECSTPISSVGECPRIGDSPLLVSDSTNASLSFTVLNMQSEANALSCVISEKGKHKQTVPATLNSRGRVKCRPAQFKYDEEKNEANFTLELVHNKQTIDNVGVSQI